MRIVHVTPFYYPIIGGGQSHIKELSERLARRGHDVTVFTQNCPDGHSTLDRALLPENEVLNGVAVRRFIPLHFPRKLLRIRGSGFLLRTIHSDYLSMWAEGPHLPRLIAETVRYQPDLVSVVNWFLPAIPYHIRLAKTIARFALVAIPLFHTEESWAHRRVQRRTLRHCDAVLVNTEHEGRFVKTLVPGTSEMHVVGVGVDPAEFAELRGRDIRARYGLGDLPVVGFVGKMISHKGVGLLAQAMKLVWRSNERVRLVLAGPLAVSEAERRTGERLLGSLSAEERSRVIHIGSFADEDKPSIFDAFDIFAMPSVGESFGIAYLEAWMCKKPVIGLRIGATQCVIREGVDGLLADPGNPTALAAAIIDLLRDPGKRHSMGVAGYHKTLARFTWEKITHKVESIYSHIAGRANARRRLNVSEHYLSDSSH
jgi:glycosyltransferase involved in cell wall biosynthesis